MFLIRIMKLYYRFRLHCFFSSMFLSMLSLAFSKLKKMISGVMLLLYPLSFCYVLHKCNRSLMFRCVHFWFTNPFWFLLNVRETIMFARLCWIEISKNFVFDWRMLKGLILSYQLLGGMFLLIKTSLTCMK